MIYLDSSVALYALLRSPFLEATQKWIDDAAFESGLVSARLLRLELTRVLRRDSLPVLDREKVTSRVHLVDETAETYAYAEGIIPHLASLDALHLATAALLGESVTIATHDTQMKGVAGLLGFAVVDPIAEMISTRL